ncbi:hypothetical protein ABLE68_13675 [Nocardioides sp. CN2-186]|uniref:hypothetical protein n=1 Tax=Nocardioides tweenelious TaxID=3156607 RepID=UPI0032B454C4
MKYAITRRVSVATGAEPDDPSPTHLECGETLTLVLGEDPLLPSSKWQCLSCLTTGALVISEDFSPRRQTALERMRPRWERGTPTWRVDGDLEQTSTWHDTLTKFFSRGIWVMSSHDDSHYTIADDSPLVLGTEVRVRAGEDGRSQLEIADSSDRRWHLVTDIVAIREYMPGILVAISSTGMCVRLDSHLTVEDEQYLAGARATW